MTELSEAERRLLPLLKEHRRTDEIAAALSLSPHTVKVHVQHIMDKTGIHDRRELARAISRGELG